jgi:hypothetical protein
MLLVGGLVAFGAYKMSTKDADRIQQHTGTDPEELTDAELEQAMQELNIEKQLRTAEDIEQGGGTPGGGSLSYLDELEKLASLRDQGVLTEEEFTMQKQRLLGTN